LDTVVFRELDAAVRDRVARSMTRLATPKGHRLIAEGDAGDELYLVQDGIFTVSYLKDGAEVVVNKKAAGDVFGEIALMFETPRTATVTAKTAGTVWVLTRDDFRAHVRRAAEAETMTMDGAKRTEVFLNSVPCSRRWTPEQPRASPRRCGGAISRRARGSSSRARRASLVRRTTRSSSSSTARRW
jgi:CRP-like cAMP-binding protein